MRTNSDIYDPADVADKFAEMFAADGWCLPSDSWSAYRARLRDLKAAHHLGPREYDALMAIGTLHDLGETTPTVAKIAVTAGCSKRTVQRATRKAEHDPVLALLKRHPRYAKVDGVNRQLPNLYEILDPPPGPVQPKPRQPGRARPGGGCQKGGPRDSTGYTKGFPSTKYLGINRPGNDVTDLMAFRRAALEEAMRQAQAEREKRWHGPPPD